MLPFLFGILGLIIGSFLNVLILRSGVRSLGGRSACESCGKVLAWHDLIPVVSWALLRGRCRYCAKNISIQYPLVEASTALLFAAIGMAPILLPYKLLALPIASLLIAIAVYDLRTTYIPDRWVFLFATLALLGSLSGTLGSGWDAVLLGPVAGSLVALPLLAIWAAPLARGLPVGMWMGFGDVKLALGMGWLLGASSGFQALFLAFMLGGLVSAPLLFFSSSFWGRTKARFTPTASSPLRDWGFTMKSEIPFGPFLIAATLIVWLSNMYGFTLERLLF